MHSFERIVSIIDRYYITTRQRTAEFSWGETATDNVKFMKKLDKKIAVSPSTATICSADGHQENAERKTPARQRFEKMMLLQNTVKAVIEDVAFNQLAPETQAKLKEAEIPIGGWSAALQRIKDFLDTE